MSKTRNPYDLSQSPDKVCTCNGSPYSICGVCLKKGKRTKAKRSL